LIFSDEFIKELLLSMLLLEGLAWRTKIAAFYETWMDILTVNITYLYHFQNDIAPENTQIPYFFTSAIDKSFILKNKYTYNTIYNTLQSLLR
jgi:hypothetical protein